MRAFIVHTDAWNVKGVILAKSKASALRTLKKYMTGSDYEIEKHLSEVKIL